MSDYEAGKLFAEEGNSPDGLPVAMLNARDPQEFVAGYMDSQFDRWLDGIGGAIKSMPAAQRPKMMKAIQGVIEVLLP